MLPQESSSLCDGEIRKITCADARISELLIEEEQPYIVGQIPSEKGVLGLIAQRKGKYVRKCWFMFDEKAWIKNGFRFGFRLNDFKTKTGQFRIKRIDSLSSENAKPAANKFHKGKQVYYKYFLVCGDAEEISDELMTDTGTPIRRRGISLDELFS